MRLPFMRWRQWFRPPRHVLLIFLAVAIGAIVTALVLIALKRWAVKKPVVDAAQQQAAVPVGA